MTPRAVAHSPITIGVVGCGHWGPNHVRVFDSLNESRVRAVADPDHGRLERVGTMFPRVRTDDDYRQLLEDPQLDAVVVATPTSTHHQIVREALDAGKHVLCEKPLAETSEEAAELTRLAQSKGCLLMVGHVFLFNPGICKLKDLIDEGELGQVQYLAASRTNLGPIRRDVNAAYDLAPHDISIFNWLIGSGPEIVSATGGSFLQPGVEDVAFISLRYPGNILASIHTSWLNPKKVREITIVGSRQMVTWDDLEPSSPVAIYDKGATTEQDYGDFGEFQRLSMWDGDIRLPKVPLDEPLRLQAERFLRYLANGRVERCDAAFGCGVVKVLEAISRSIERDGAPVEVAPDAAARRTPVAV